MVNTVGKKPGAIIEQGVLDQNKSVEKINSRHRSKKQQQAETALLGDGAKVETRAAASDQRSDPIRELSAAKEVALSLAERISQQGAKTIDIHRLDPEKVEKLVADAI
jgi:hypothetical protein